MIVNKEWALFVLLVTLISFSVLERVDGVVEGFQNVSHLVKVLVLGVVLLLLSFDRIPGGALKFLVFGYALWILISGLLTFSEWPRLLVAFQHFILISATFWALLRLFGSSYLWFVRFGVYFVWLGVFVGLGSLLFSDKPLASGGVFENRNYLAIFYAVGLIFSAFIYHYRSKPIYLFLCFLFVIFLLSVPSRASWLMVGVAVSGFYLYCFSVRPLSIYGIFFLVLIPLVSYFLSDGVVLDRFLSRGDAGRIEIWEGALDAFLRNWVTGLGPGGFNFSGLSAHNIFLSQAANLGLLGVVLFLWICVWVIFVYFRSLVGGTREFLNAFCLSFFLGIIGHQFFEVGVPIPTSPLGFVFLMIVAVAAGSFKGVRLRCDFSHG